MAVAEICQLPVRDRVGPNAYLFLWSLTKFLLDGSAKIVANAWGFEVVEEIVWVKNRAGVGRHTRHQHELLLICKRGHLPAPPTDAVPASVQHFDVGEHSEKPREFYDLIERMTPGLDRRLEMFARGLPRPGWKAWGNEVELPEVLLEAAE
jgi:N6-adenosine-specific RNA methylase IME4